MIRSIKKRKSLLGVIHCQRVEINGPKGKPFFVALLSAEQGQLLLTMLEELVAQEGRYWYFLTSTSPDPTRLRLVDLNRTPEFERAAGKNYLRGEIFRVTGKSDSCNINFSAPVGAKLLADRLRTTLTRSKKFLQIVVPNRHGNKDLIEFIADVDCESSAVEEAGRLGSLGSALAAVVLEPEDFSDWE